MRVLQAVPFISPAFGGPSVALTSLARCLTRHGVETTLLTTDVDPHGSLDVPLDTPFTRDGAEYIVHHVSPALGRFGYAPGMARALRDVIASYDVVHIHWLYNFTCIAAARAAMAGGVPFVVQPNGSLDPFQMRKNRLVKRTYLATVGRPLLTRSAAMVFTAEQERALAAYGQRRPEWIVPIGLDPDSYRDLPPRGRFREMCPGVDGPFLLSLGRLDPKKGLELLIGGFAHIAARHPGLQLVIAGPGSGAYPDGLRNLASRLGVSARVHFVGLLSHEAKLAAFVDAEMFVLPSYAENFGAVVTEALACGLPVVMSNRVNIWQEMSAAGVAIVVNCSVDSVADGIQRALADTSFRPRVGAAGPALVRESYTWDAIVPRLAQHYAAVVDRAGNASRVSHRAR